MLFMKNVYNLRVIGLIAMEYSILMKVTRDINK